MFFSGQKLDREVSQFGHKQGKGFGKRASHPHSIFIGRTPRVLDVLQSVQSPSLRGPRFPATQHLALQFSCFMGFLNVL